MGLQTFNELAPINQGITLNNASGTANVELTNQGMPVWRVDQIIVVSTDSASRVMRLLWHTASSALLLGSATIPAGAGTAAAPSIDLIQAIAVFAGRGIDLPAGDYLMVAMESAITSPLTIVVVAMGGTL